MAEYSRLATGSFTSTGAAKAIYLPFAPTSVKVWNYSSFATPAQNGVPEGYWNSGMGQGYAVINAFNATPVLTTDIISTNGISTFSAGLSFQYGAQIAISGITKASLSGSPSGAYVKKVLYPFLYAPGVSFITAITTGSTTTIDTTAPHNLVVGQEVAFHIPSSWGTIQLNENNNTIIPSSPVYGYVVSVTDSNTVVVNINSSSYTAFDSNQTVAAVKAGLSFPQMCAVGDVNTGGVAISAGSPLYPSPVVNSVSTINGPAIQGSFVNNTRQGFIIGAGVGATLTSAALIGANGNTLFWEAMIPDYS
jgi:hypothetical protein